MSEKRRDKRRRVLRVGETQNKDGKYRYSYTDSNGKRKEVYSWKLEITDPLPKGKRECVALRDLESEIRKVEEQHRSLTATDMTVYDLVEWYTANKAGVKATTRTGYKTVRNLLQDDPFGKRKITAVKSRDAKDYLVKLQRIDGKSYSTVHTVRGVLRGAFREASFREWVYKKSF